MARRVDDNQREVVAALRKMGCLVHITSDLGSGFPDLVCSKNCSTGNKKIFLIEVKNGKRSPCKQRLTPDEAKFHEIWKEHVVIINSVDQAIDFVNNKN